MKIELEIFNAVYNDIYNNNMAAPKIATLKPVVFLMALLDASTETPWVEEPVLPLSVCWTTAVVKVYLVLIVVTLTEAATLVAWTWALTEAIEATEDLEAWQTSSQVVTVVVVNLFGWTWEPAATAEAEAAEDIEAWQASSQAVTVVVVNLLTWTSVPTAAAAEADAADLAEWHFSSQTVAIVVVKEVIVIGAASLWALSELVQVVMVSVSTSLSVTVVLEQPPEQEVMVSISVETTDWVETMTVLLLTAVEYSVWTLLEVMKEVDRESASTAALVTFEDWIIFEDAEASDDTMDEDGAEEVITLVEDGIVEISDSETDAEDEGTAELESLEIVDSGATADLPASELVVAAEVEEVTAGEEIISLEEEVDATEDVTSTEEEGTTEVELSWLGSWAEALWASALCPLVEELIIALEEVGRTADDVEEVDGTTEDVVEEVVEDVVVEEVV